MTRKKHNYGTITINGKRFECDFNQRSALTYDDVDIHTPYTYLDVWSAYQSPSIYKREVWEEWLEWFNQYAFKDSDLCISSKNSQKFTITGKLRNAEIEETADVTDVYLRITADHNRAYFLKK